MAGWEVTLADFHQLIGYPDYRPTIAPLFKKWFDYTLEGSRADTVVRSSRGDIVDLTELHQRIQSSPALQYELYQEAQSLWR
jgi:hypothetical protein